MLGRPWVLVVAERVPIVDIVERAFMRSAVAADLVFRLTSGGAVPISMVRGAPIAAFIELDSARSVSDDLHQLLNAGVPKSDLVAILTDVRGNAEAKCREVGVESVLLAVLSYDGLEDRIYEELLARMGTEG